MYRTLFKALDYIEMIFPEANNKIYNLGVLDAVHHHEEYLKKRTHENTDEELQTKSKVILKFRNGYYLVKLITPEERN